MTIMRSRKLTFWLNRPLELLLTSRSERIQTRLRTTISSSCSFSSRAAVFCLLLLMEMKFFCGAVWPPRNKPWEGVPVCTLNFFFQSVSPITLNQRLRFSLVSRLKEKGVLLTPALTLLLLPAWVPELHSVNWDQPLYSVLSSFS